MINAVPTVPSAGFTAATASTEPPRVHLAYLDGLRGAAALYVVLYHLWQFVVTRPDLGATPSWFKAFSILKGGHFAVAIFIVLSGYCLMLPTTRTRGFLAGGLREFALRRARRILPPYFAALLLSVGLIVATPLGAPTNTQWHIALPALTPGSLATHLSLTHNLFREYQWKINPPLWSVALEWQIYFVFALVLLPIFRRSGIFAAVAVAFVLGLLPVASTFRFASTWYLGLFALGMAACTINFPAPGQTARLSASGLGWKIGGAFLGLLSAAVIVVETRVPLWAADIIVGSAVASLLIVSTDALQKLRPAGMIVKLLSSRPLVLLGAFSYSLYLLHFPLLALSYHLLHLRFSPLVTFFLLTLLVLPLLVTFCYGFYLMFERPFLQRRKTA